ncbi:MAG: hypothetical protein NZT61_05755 [Deltaproteobacteria bacterium]|nr:hypothetical protein [Deltaproteobacteria bacterium]
MFFCLGVNRKLFKTFFIATLSQYPVKLLKKGLEFFKLILSLFAFAFFIGLFYQAGVALNYAILVWDSVNLAGRLSVTRGRYGVVWLDPSDQSRIFSLASGLLSTQPNSRLFSNDLQESNQLTRAIFSDPQKIGLAALAYNNAIKETVNPDQPQNVYITISVPHVLAIAFANTFISRSLGPATVEYPCTNPGSGQTCFTCFVSPIPGCRSTGEISPESFVLRCVFQNFGLFSGLFNSVLRVFGQGMIPTVRNFTQTGQNEVSVIVSRPSMLVEPWVVSPQP